MKVSRLAFLAALAGPCARLHSPPGTPPAPGMPAARNRYRNKPPILLRRRNGGDQSQVYGRVDGFAREIYGRIGNRPRPGRMVEGQAGRKVRNS